MTEFVCRVANATGEVYERSINAVDEATVRRDLESQDLMILDVRKPSALIGALKSLFRIKRGISMSEFLIFNQELAALVRAGLPIVPSLELLIERRDPGIFRDALQDIRERVKGGEALSEAFQAQGDLVPPLYSASLASGETTGDMGAVLARFIEYTKKVLAIRSKVISSMIYPAVLLVLSLGLIGLMVFFIIPKFETFLSGFDTELPLLTRVVVGSATFITSQWKIVVVVLISLFIGMGTWGRTSAGLIMVDRIKLRLPLVGKIIRFYAQTRFTRTLAALQAGGLPLVNSLELAARAAGNRVFESALFHVVGRVREGQSLWESLDETKLMTGISVQMIKVGESTGALVEMLENASEFTENEIDQRLTRLVALVEPLMLVFMAILVAIMLMSVYMPLINLYGNSGGF
ncbi:MAG: type II secretion system F family protein [Acidobacteriota bacterium]|nr:type II secretion system F family protein [Acidobacteriota bacterium]MDH3783856.1 type II secretion system F family protein [Acidobacteriota bacterium]